MAAPFAREDLEKLKNFIDFVSKNPLILNMPQLSFVKQFVEKLGGKVPEGEFKMPDGGKCPFSGREKSETTSKPEDDSTSPDVDEEESSEDSEIELDMEGVIEADEDAEQAMGDSNKTPTEEEIDKASELRSKAAAAYSEQNYQEAIDLYTQAIELNPGNALFHAKRGQAFLKLKKPNACIRDCNKALQINCDSAAAYKFRGRAHRLLGNWEEAAKDLRQACKLDFDEEADEWLREVTPNAKKIEQHRLKQQRKKEERERRAAEARRQKARQQQQQQQQQEQSSKAGSGGGFSANLNMNDILSGVNDPEVMAALQDILKNPANIDKYKSNPKIAKLLDIFKKGFPGGMPTSFPGGMPGGMPGGGFPGAFPSSDFFAQSSNTDTKTDTATDGAGGETSANKPEADAPKPERKKPDFVDDGLD